MGEGERWRGALRYLKWIGKEATDGAGDRRCSSLAIHLSIRVAEPAAGKCIRAPRTSFDGCRGVKVNAAGTTGRSGASVAFDSAVSVRYYWNVEGGDVHRAVFLWP
jgi:hypothetical protein